jgi:hypothetical protein
MGDLEVGPRDLKYEGGFLIRMDLLVWDVVFIALAPGDFRWRHGRGGWVRFLRDGRQADAQSV